ncbi:MAG: hypothetical protein HDQ96_09950 [Lachnospiraceae bacterium]|nr:hypothetical protein [Lachnospiraceae bacterium]
MKNQDFIVPPFMDPYTMLKNISEQNDIALRHVFEGRIRSNFLIIMKDQVLRELGPENLMKYYDLHWSDMRMIKGIGEALEYDVCRMIVGIHRAYSIFLSKQEIRKNEKDERYRKCIVTETIEKIKLHLYASKYFRKQILFSGEEFLYYPLPYGLFAISVKIGEILKGDYQLKYWQLYYGIVHNGLSALVLMEDNLLGGAYPLCRGAIEIYVKLLILNRQTALFEDYEKYRMYEIEQSCCSQKYPKEFYVLFKARNCKNSKSKNDYLHFGWVDFIDDYHSVVKKAPYSVYGLITFLKNKHIDKISELERLEHLYKSCHAYTHGNVQMAVYPLLHYFEISIMLYYVIRGTFLLLCNEKEIESKIGEIDIIPMIDRDFKILFAQYMNRSTEKFEEHEKQ